MTISNYTQLQTAVATWLQRDNMTSVIPDLITLAESRINRELRLAQQELTATVTLTSGNNYANLPTGFLELISLTYDTDDYVPEQVPMRTLDEYASTSSSKPQYFAISDKFYFECPADATYTLTARFWEKWDIASDTTNWLLTNYPGVYLFGALSESGIYMKHPNLTTWEEKFVSEVKSIQHADSKNKGRSKLRVDEAFISRGNYNIFTDC